MRSPHIIVKHFFAVILLFFIACSQAEETDATFVVEELHTALLNVMQKAESLDFQGRYDTLAPVIQSRFDIPLIAKVVLSRYWNELDQQKQNSFIELFRRLSIATYASRFDDYTGESFKTISVEQLKKGRQLIKTELISPDSEPVRLDYLMHSIEGKWYIISVIADGVNDLSLKRAEYATIINERGFENLIVEIEKKIKELGDTSTKG
ncbi:MAG: ABC transporter substrate-binding protein [Gammaproteobacteria bacterium]|nr:ABC transporter substrate-binding protein [Gammaproteobacteria bacterium]